MASINNNKESFELLRGTPDSNSGSEVSEIVFPARKKRFRRRLRNNPSTKHDEVINECKCKARTVSLTLFCIVLICWLITLTWLAVVLHSELIRLNVDVAKVVAGSQGVPDALQKCHSLSRDLQKNQSQIMDRLTGFSLLLNNFSVEMTEVKNGLHTVQDQLKSSTDLVNNPNMVKDLSTSVASFGSRIKDLGATVSSLKNQHNKLDSIVNSLVKNITEMRKELTELSIANKEKAAFTEKNFAVEKENIMTAITEVLSNVTSLNNTLSNKLQRTDEDQSKDHKLIEGLLERNENITARVISLEGLCAKKPGCGDNLPLNLGETERTVARTDNQGSSQPPPSPPQPSMATRLEVHPAPETKTLEHPT